MALISNLLQVLQTRVTSSFMGRFQKLKREKLASKYCGFLSHEARKFYVQFSPQKRKFLLLLYFLFECISCKLVFEMIVLSSFFCKISGCPSLTRLKKIKFKTARQVCEKKNILAINKCVWKLIEISKVLKNESEYNTVQSLFKCQTKAIPPILWILVNSTNFVDTLLC